MATVFEGNLFADYHQFYLADPNETVDYADGMSDEAINQRILCYRSVLVVFTARNMHVPVRVQIHDAEPSLTFNHVDHVARGSFYSSGTIVIAGCTDYLPDAKRFTAPHGNLRALVLLTGLDTLSDDGLEGNDSYSVHLWPGDAIATSVLKQARDT